MHFPNFPSLYISKITKLAGLTLNLIVITSKDRLLHGACSRPGFHGLAFLF